MADGIGECGLFPEENLPGQEAGPVEGVAQKVLALAVGVDLDGGVKGHDVVREGQVAEGNPGLQRVDRNAAVRPEYIIIMQFPHPLLGFGLEVRRGGRKVRVLVAEELVTYLPGQENPDIRVLMDVLAKEVHADRSPDGRDVPGAESLDELGKDADDLVTRHDDFRVVRAQVLCGLPRVLEVDGPHVHADGKGPKGLVRKPLGNRAYKG